jgi:hypothetical protein
VAPYFYDSVGRRRKLSDVQMRTVRRLFAEGAKVVDLAERFGVSPSLISNITYNTPRDADVERMREARSDVRPDEDPA